MSTENYSEQNVPLQCEREPIHIVNRIQNCGTLIVVDSNLIIVQCSTNAVDMLPDDFEFLEESDSNATTMGYDPKLDAIIGEHLGILLEPEPVEQVAALVSTCEATADSDRDAFRDNRASFVSYISHGSMSSLSASLRNSGITPTPGSGRARKSSSHKSTASARNFLIRTKSTGTMGGRRLGRQSCSVTQSGEHFLVEIEDIAASQVGGSDDIPEDIESDRDVMVFLESMAKELRRCWSIEEMAGLVCGRIMNETPYDRGMVYRFDQGDGSGEIIYESFRGDARYECRKDSFLGLRFPASDIPRQARELFMRNTLRYVYDVNGKDWPLYPSLISCSKVIGEPRYTDLSMCRLRGSSYVHLQYLRNMKVTSTLVIAIIVNKRLWGLYSFHGYRQPIAPSARTRFLCEMASIMTSMVMESLSRKDDHMRLMDLERTLLTLRTRQSTIVEFMDANYESFMNLLDVNTIAFRIHHPEMKLHIYGVDDPVVLDENNEEAQTETGSSTISNSVFSCLLDTYGQVCKDYGTVYINEQKSHPALVAAGLHTLAFAHFSGMDILVSRQATVERVQWGGDPDKKLEPDGTLTPRNSFAALIKGHLKKGKPWDDADKSLINRFVEQVEKYRSNEIYAEQSEAIQTLQEEKMQAMEANKSNFDFFAFMAHELRTPFHGILGSLEAMREDPDLANNEMLRTAELCGKNMLRILDDILLIAKGSYSLELDEQCVDVLEFLRQTLADMTSYAYTEGVSIRVRKKDIHHHRLHSDFSRIRQVIHNLVSNAIKFSDDDISIEILQRGSFADVMSVWRTYTNSYAACEPSMRDLAEFEADSAKAVDSQVTIDNDGTVWLIVSVIDKGIGINAPDLKKLGSAFTQLSQGRQKRYQGTGLGINICNMIVTALRGKLVAFSAPDYGSCFTFAVPVKSGGEDQIKNDELDIPSPQDEKEARRKKLRDEFQDLGLASKNLKVLVVDDSSINRKLCSRKIKSWLPSVAITECTNGQDFLKEYKHDHSIIMGVFLDFHMHGMDGDECARRIREFEGTYEDSRRVYIAGYTADVLDDSTEALLTAGMDSVIPKPEPQEAFEMELRNMMKRFAGVQ